MGQTLPLVGIVIGEPAGIGPEVLARILASGQIQDCCSPLLIGSRSVMERAVAATGHPIRFRAIRAANEVRPDAGAVNILDSAAIPASQFPLGVDSAAAGNAVAAWMDEGQELARSGSLDALVMAPISSGSYKLAGQRSRTVSPVLGESYLVIFSGPLRVAHLTDHVPLAGVSELLSAQLIGSALCSLDGAMRKWGVRRRRIGVAGFNPHAAGKEEREAITPGIAMAQAEGVDATGPISPDVAFRHCIEGRYDMVLAMYHDQGHIAVKTWGFAGNCVLILGHPYVFLSVAHGTAYDIVGTGQADCSMLSNAIRTAAHLASGRGIPDPG